MRCCLSVLIVVAGLLARPVSADEIEPLASIVIDTDMGLDDAVALAMALQAPHTQVTAIVASAGVASRDRCVEYVGRMLDLFNRPDIALYAGDEPEQEPAPPPFRSFAEQTVGRALGGAAAIPPKPFTADAYLSKSGKASVLVLGPLSSLAAALKDKPQIAQSIGEVIVAGPPEPEHNWNLQRQPAALEAVRAAGLALKFVVPGSAGVKPQAWRQGPLAIGPGTSIGEGFCTRLLADPVARKHYLETFGGFHDELALIYCLTPAIFSAAAEGVVMPKDNDSVVEAFVHLVGEGRQHKHRVVFVEGVLPDEVLQADVRERKARIIANNGEDEWFAQLLMNELHEHLGAYSVVGVKMGLRAAELLNAPQHRMSVVSHSAAKPPVSCLNDGIIVATGCTPGRILFKHVPGPPGCTRVTFSYNGRQVTLALKEQYQQKVAAAIKAILQKHALESHEYWDEVRRFGLDIWEQWHRRDLFETVDDGDTAQQ